MEILKPSQVTLAKAVSILNKGGVVICPTDTVYGFLADASNKKAVEKIYKIKKRPKSKPLSLFVKNMAMARKIAEIDARQAKILKKFWPGKYTFILNRFSETKSHLGDLVSLKTPLYGVKKDTIALRIPNYPFLNKLLKKIDRPLVQTSVNISTQEPLKNGQAIIEVFGKNRLVGLIINGGSIKNAKPSKIVDLTSKKMLTLR